MILLDGLKVSEQIKKRLAKEVASLPKLHLVVLLIGDNPASHTYVGKKQKMCEDLSIKCTVQQFPSAVSQAELLKVIDTLNADKKINGSLLQMPLPKQLQAHQLLDRISVTKDVDGLNSQNVAKVLLGQETILPCTPKGVLDLLAAYDISIQGKNVCIIGFSDVVGKPLAIACLNRRATVTVCHSKTDDLKAHTVAADIIMVATGVPGLIKADMIKQGAVVVDIGITRENGKIVGDVDFENVKKKASYISPVPGGVGPMTVISLVQNLVLLAQQHRSQT